MSDPTGGGRRQQREDRKSRLRGAYVRTPEDSIEAEAMGDNFTALRKTTAGFANAAQPDSSLIEKGIARVKKALGGS